MLARTLPRHRRLAAVLATLALSFSLSGEPHDASAQARPRAGASSAPRPYEAQQRELEAEVVRAGRSPRAMIPLLELWRMWNDAPPASTVQALERLSANSRLSVPVRQYAAQLLARARTRIGDPDASARAFDELGYIDTWRVVGPFDNEGKTGFARAFEPEAGRMQPVDLAAQFEGRERGVAWRMFPEVSQYGYVSFDAVYRPDTNVCAYAETFVTSERAQALTLWLGGGGATRAWWNGEEVMSDAAYRQPDPDRQVAMVGAHQGLNRLLVKACVTETTWGFFARLGDPSGMPARGLTYSTEGDATQVRPGHGVPRLPRAPQAPLAALESAASG
ncbi:MAG: hypothetical protein M3Y87_20465, partial [Myxococcota bacterium]|nr:hypothetical protein [Myxococcota bacterium]